MQFMVPGNFNRLRRVVVVVAADANDVALLAQHNDDAVSARVRREMPTHRKSMCDVRASVCVYVCVCGDGDSGVEMRLYEHATSMGNSSH